MPTRTFNLSEQSLVFLVQQAAKHGGNVSAGLEEIITAHRFSTPAIKKQAALDNLRQGATALHDLDIPLDAIVSWVQQAAGGD